MKPQTHTTETILWGCKLNQPDYMEEILYQCKGYTNLDDLLNKGNQWAKNNGYNRIRISVIELNKKPDFSKAINI